ncbi:hypothetical protein G7046_g8114 [Stylonectria norvegica]|nr:hypothetical protein G7046_g8114 [Stylonectria norvegica]
MSLSTGLGRWTRRVRGLASADNDDKTVKTDTYSSFRPGECKSTSRMASSKRGQGIIAPQYSPRPVRSTKWLLSTVALFLLWATTYLVATFTTQLDGLIPGRRSASKSFSRTQLESFNPPSHDAGLSTSRRLRVFMAADEADVNLCKTVMSAVALGYPAPTLLNWHGECNRPDGQVAKLECLLGAIEAVLDPGSDEEAGEDDLVLLVEAYDVWFQLPPSVLIERYHQLNREADERVRKQWESLGVDASFPILPPRQKIVMSTAKECFPDSDSGPDAHWPESPVRSDLYDEGTDQLVSTADPGRKYSKLRPRCVNSGMIMGTMGALRDALRRSREKADLAPMSGRSDQAFFGEVMDDQEVWREWARHLRSSWNGRSSIPRSAAGDDEDVHRIVAAAVQGQRFEFGIGLDYNSTTIPPTSSSEDDGFFVALNDGDDVEEASARAGVPGAVRIHGLPRELRGHGAVDSLLAAGTTWGDVPLYTDFYLGVTPVGIHHDTHGDDLKPWRLQYWWHLMWYHPQLRELVTRRHDAVVKPLARIDGEAHDEDVVYWAPTQETEVLVTVMEGKALIPIGWDAVCQGLDVEEKWYDEVFGDGGGPLEMGMKALRRSG